MSQDDHPGESNQKTKKDSHEPSTGKEEGQGHSHRHPGGRMAGGKGEELVGIGLDQIQMKKMEPVTPLP